MYIRLTFTGPSVELQPVTATLSSTYHDNYRAAFCIDGNTHDRHGSICVTNGERMPWIAIDYGTRVIIETVEIFNRLSCCGDRTRNIDVRISDELPTTGSERFPLGTLFGHFAGPGTDGQHIIISGRKQPKIIGC